MKKDKMIERLINDYGEYLSDFNEKQLKIIIESGCFTLREAQKK